MKETLFNFITLRHIQKSRVKANQQSNPKGIVLNSHVLDVTSNASMTHQEQWDFVVEEGKIIGPPLAVLSPHLSKVVANLSRVGYDVSPNELKDLVEDAYGTEIDSVLNFSTYQGHFASIANIIASSILLGKEIGSEWFEAYKVTHLIRLYEAGNPPSSNSQVEEILRNPVSLPFSVVEFIAKGNPSTAIPSETDSGETDKEKKIKELKEEAKVVEMALSDTKIRHAKEVIPVIQTPQGKMNLRPSLELQYTEDTKKEFDPKTIAIIEKEGFDFTELPVSAVRSALRTKHQKISLQLGGLIGPATTKKIYLNGKMQSLEELRLGRNAGKGPSFPTKPFNQFMRPLGIGELRTVEQVNIKYEIGEIAHIENVLKGESKVRDHVRESSTETTVDSETFREETTEKELQTTSRHELSSETRKLQKEQSEFDVGVKVNASYGPFLDITANTSYGTAQSKETSQSTSSNYAQEVVEKAASRIRESVRERRTLKTIQKITETNNHTLDNKGGPGHVVGIYRWLNKVYDAQVRTHGHRMMYEFNLPEPAAFYTYSQVTHPDEQFVLDKPDEPIYIDSEGESVPLSPEHIDETNYTLYGANYKVRNLVPPPSEEVLLSRAFAEKVASSGGGQPDDFLKTWEVSIPSGYLPTMVNGAGWLAFGATHSIVVVSINKKRAEVVGADYNSNTQEFNPAFTVHGDLGMSEFLAEGSVQSKTISIAIHATHSHAISLTLVVTCKRSSELFRAWQIESFEKITSAYYELKAQYDEKLQALNFSEGITIQGKNPARNEQVMETELKKQCISFMTKSYLDRFRSLLNIPVEGTDLSYPEINFGQAYKDSAKIQFFEQAFEWGKMMYKFYPYFWSPKDNWIVKMDQDSHDPRFAEFLRAGAARVILAVREGYEEAVAHYFQSGQLPREGLDFSFDDSLFVDIIDELKEEQSTDQGKVSETWPVRIPTNLVILDDPAAIERVGQIFNPAPEV